VEIRKYPVDISEHRGHFYWCAKCEKQHDAPVPPEIEKAGLCGPRLTTLIAYLKGACHASFSTIRKFLRDVAGIRVSRGMLAKVIGKVSWALAEPYAELRGLLPGLGRVNVDETGHKENRAKMWTWCFRAELFVLFKIDSSRGSRVLVETLGAEFNGVLGCDYFSAYRKYMKDCDVSVQFCLAHLIRDVKFLVTLPDAATRAYGERLLTGLRGLFGAIHKGGTSMPAELAPARARILLAAKTNIPATREAQNMAKRFELHGDAYFQFITTPGIEPTNNLAEQAIRFVVIDRLVTQGTRSEKGRRWCERIWTAVATCSLQAASVFDFIESAVRASFNGLKSPSLLPATS
jgi:transposase